MIQTAGGEDKHIAFISWLLVEGKGGSLLFTPVCLVEAVSGKQTDSTCAKCVSVSVPHTPYISVQLITW